MKSYIITHSEQWWQERALSNARRTLRLGRQIIAKNQISIKKPDPMTKMLMLVLSLVGIDTVQHVSNTVNAVAAPDFLDAVSTIAKAIICIVAVFHYFAQKSKKVE